MEPLFHKHASKSEQKEAQTTEAKGAQGLWEKEPNKTTEFYKVDIL